MSQLQISFEFFPPKSAESFANFKIAAGELAQMHPHFFSVTYGAGGSTRDGSIETLKLLNENFSVPIAPHLSCIGSTKDSLSSLLQIFKSMGARRIVALRGDLPSGMGNCGELRYASDLIAFIRQEMGNYFHIEVAAYPEFHPQANCSRDDFANFKRKVEAGADSAITQYFFNVDSYFYFREECDKANIHIPIIPGIMPILSFSRLARFSEMCGAEIPRWLSKKLASYQDDVEGIKQFGFEVVHKLCEQLIKGGAPGLHFYTLNHSQPTVNLVNSLTKIAAGKHFQSAKEMA
jgi:methylenetetrahydrofolate reductase (NADPH)